MFVRFRPEGRRVRAILTTRRRLAGKIKAEDIGALGSVDAEVSVRGRLAFWAALPGRLARLGNRVSTDELAAIYAALHARIPMVTADEQRVIQEESARAEVAFWDAMRNIDTSNIAGHKEIIALAQKAIAKAAPDITMAEDRLATARDRLDRLAKGEAIAGGLGKPLDMREALRGAGFTERDLRRIALWGALTRDESEALFSAGHMENVLEAARNVAVERELRRVIAKRKQG